MKTFRRLAKGFFYVIISSNALSIPGYSNIKPASSKFFGSTSGD